MGGPDCWYDINYPVDPLGQNDKRWMSLRSQAKSNYLTRNPQTFLANHKTVTCHEISLQTMQDANVAMGVDRILTEVLTIMKCQFVRFRFNNSRPHSI